MSKSNKIKWRREDSERLAKAVKQYNYKREKLIQQNPYIEDFLPPKKTVREEKTKIYNRADYNRVLNSVNRFKKNNDSEKLITNENGLTLTLYELREVQNLNRIRNIKKAIELKQLELSKEKGNLSQTIKQNLKPTKFNFNNKTADDWDNFYRSAEKRVKGDYYKNKTELYKKNYLKAIDEQLGSNGKDLYNYIKKQPAEHLFKNGVGNPLLAIDTPYEISLSDEGDNLGQIILAEWQSL